MAERRHDDCKEWWQRALRHASTRARKGAREWSGEVQGALGVELTIYRCRRRAGEAATGGNWWLNGLQAIDGRGWLRIGINPMVKVGGVKAWR
jgi:hypothetical protein